jgi:hypothetical protein
LPLALPEWRSERSAGRLDSSPDTLRLTQSAHAARLYVPLFVDLDSKRIKKQYTWRRLTVAEFLRVQPADVAVGYRVQVGSAQWLFYRGLTPGNRSILGQNFSTQFVAARFGRDGQAHKLLEIE